MVTPLKLSTKPTSFTANNLINQTRALFSELPDIRKKATANNLKYAIFDAALSAFSVFFTPSPSFLDYQVRMQKKLGKNNAQSLFGVHQIPSANPIRNLLDPVPPETIYPLLAFLLATKLCLVVSAEEVLLRLPRQAELGSQALPSETW